MRDGHVSFWTTGELLASRIPGIPLSTCPENMRMEIPSQALPRPKRKICNASATQAKPGDPLHNHQATYLTNHPKMDYDTAAFGDTIQP